MQEHFKSDEFYVWPDFDGEVRGQEILPLYKESIKNVREDNLFYKLLALTDVIRVGRSRELKVAIRELKNIILHEL